MVTAVGDLLAGRYRLRRLIGSGAMGAVWEAVDERLGRPVAVKQLLVPPGLDAARSEQARQRAMREGRIAARLQHPHAVAVYDVVVDDGLPVLVMEYVPSRSLADLLAAHGRLEPAAAARIGAQAASALAAAHAAGIVHRDVKPGNVLIADGDTAKISDFGISHASGDVALTQTGMFAGTPAFLAPEVAQGHPATPSSDVFSLGATLYATVEGRPPFGEDGDNPLALLRVVAAGEVPAARRAGPLTPVLDAMLRADPAQRLTAAQAEQALRAVADGDLLPDGVHPDVARGPSGTLLDNRPEPISVAAPARRRRWLLAASVMAAVLAVALLVGLLASGTDPTPSPAPTAGEVERAVAEYYRLLPEEPERAWSRLGPRLRAEGKGEYLAFWDDVATVELISQPRATGARTVHVGVELTLDDGTRVREFHQFGVLVRGDRLLLDADTMLHTERITPPPQPDEEKKDEDKDRDKEQDKEGEGDGGDDRKGEEDKTGEEDKSGHG